MLEAIDCCGCSKEVIETKYGDITDPEVIDMANSLHLWFIDSINDAVYSGEDEYQEYFAARNLFSYPEQFYNKKAKEKPSGRQATKEHKMRLAEPDIFGVPPEHDEDGQDASQNQQRLEEAQRELYQAMKFEEEEIMLEEGLNADEKKDKLNDMYNRYAAKADALKERIKSEATNAQLQDINKEEEDRASNFSASFYGPLFNSSITLTEQSEQEEEEVHEKEHRYYLVKDTHAIAPNKQSAKFNFKYDDSNLSRQLRCYILTNRDARGKNCLHYAAQFGDKHFATMIVEEARFLDILYAVADIRDKFDKTPLYYLTELGSRVTTLSKQDPEEEERLAVEKVKKEITEAEQNKDKGIDEDAQGMEPDDIELGSTSIFNQIIDLGYGETIANVKLFKKKKVVYNTLKDEEWNAKQPTHTLYLILFAGHEKKEDMDIQQEFEEKLTLIKENIVDELKAQEIDDPDKCAIEVITQEDWNALNSKKDVKFDERQKEKFRKAKEKQKKLEKEIQEFRISKPQLAEVMEGARYSRHVRLPDLIDDENEVPSRNYMVRLLIEAGSNPNIQSPEVLMTPLHWLAFHGDHRAVTKIMDMNKMAYIETNSQCCGISLQTQSQFVTANGAFNAFVSANNQTPVDIAGDMGNLLTLQSILKFFHETDRDHIILAFATEKIVDKFGRERFSRQDSGKMRLSKSDTPSMRIPLCFLNSKDFNKEQDAYLRLAYWSISTANLEKDFGFDDGEAEIFMKRFVYFFVLDLGVSPFVKSYRKRSLMHACVESGRLDFMRELLSHRYECWTEDEALRLIKTTACKDEMGDNIYHSIFQQAEHRRNEFLELISNEKYRVKVFVKKAEPGCCASNKIKTYMEENQQEDEEGHDLKETPYDEVFIGDFYKRNRLSFKPTDFEHDSIEVTKKLINESNDIRKEIMNNFQADYVITCNAENHRYDIVVDSLIDMKFEENQDFFVFDEEGNMLDSVVQNVTGGDAVVNIAIKFPQNRLDNIAGIKRIFGDLDAAQIRVPYDEDMQDEFTAFDARQKITCMQLLLEDQIDFEWLEKAEIIIDHYPLHHRQQHIDIHDSLCKYICKFFCSIMCCGACNHHWKKYAQPLHMIKKYYGEKMAFFVAFFLNYTAHLMFPALLGIGLFSYQMYLLYWPGNPKEDKAGNPISLATVIDSPINALGGVIVALWVSILIERWREMEQELMHEWDMDVLEDILKSDERIGEFRYQYEYNELSNTKEKVALGNTGLVKLLHVFVFLIFIGGTIAVIYIFEKLTADKLQVSSTAAISEFMQDFTDPKTILYGFVLQVLSYLYNFITYYFIQAYNYQFKKDYNDSLAQWIFYYNFLNFYMPMYYAAFLSESRKGSFTTLYTLLIVELGFGTIKDYAINFIWILYYKYKKQAAEESGKEVLEKAETMTDYTQMREHRKAFIQVQVNVNSVMMEADEEQIPEGYMDILKQFGYVAMFTQVFPLAGILAFIERLLALSLMLCNFSFQRRMEPSISMGAGIFLTLLEMMGFISVFVNTALIYFTSPKTKEQIMKWTKSNSETFLLYVILAEHCLFIMKYVIQMIFSTDDNEKFLDSERANAEIMRQYFEKKHVIEETKKNKNHDVQRERWKKALRQKQTEDAMKKLNKDSVRKHQDIRKMLIKNSADVQLNKFMREQERKRKAYLYKHTKLKEIDTLKRQLQDGYVMSYTIFPDDKKDKTHYTRDQLRSDFTKKLTSVHPNLPDV